MPTTSGTPTRRLAEHLMGEPMTDYIARRRAEGRSWRLIARDVREATGGQVDVTYETIRSWATAVAS